MVYEKLSIITGVLLNQSQWSICCTRAMLPTVANEEAHKQHAKGQCLSP